MGGGVAETLAVDPEEAVVDTELELWACEIPVVVGIEPLLVVATEAAEGVVVIPRTKNAIRTT